MCWATTFLFYIFFVFCGVIKNREYLKFDPRRIDKGVEYHKVYKIPKRRSELSGLWPYVAKMLPGDVYIYEDKEVGKKPDLKTVLERQCVKYTGMTLAENNLMVVEKAAKDGVIMLKY